MLIGSTFEGYINELLEEMEEKGVVWSAWDFRIRNEWRNAINGKLKSIGKFPLFLYLSKRMGGSGKVEFVAVFSEIIMSDEPTKSPDPSLTSEREKRFPTEDFRSYTWFKFEEVLYLGQKDLNVFRDIDTEDPIVPSQLRSAFAYAYPAEEFFKEAEEKLEALTDIEISVEKDLRRYLVSNLESLEKGLKLFSEDRITGEEYNVPPVGRIDILAMDKNKDFVVIEIKAGTADPSSYGQISAYMGWVQKNLVKEKKKVRGIIVANNFDEKLKSAIILAPNIKLVKYELKFEFKEERTT